MSERAPGNPASSMQYLSQPVGHAAFESAYLETRGKEARLLDDEVVARLPYIGADDSPNYREWAARATSFKRLSEWFKSFTTAKSVLDVGCGNGWAAAGLAEQELLNVTAVDINEQELLQATRIFQRPNLRFYYGNIFEDIFEESSFDIVVLNSSAQYFDNIQALIQRLFHYLRPGGEIHILDTPFYKDAEIESAKARSEDYYRSIACPEMAEHYHHHRLSDLSPFNYEVLSRTGIGDKIKSLFRNRVPENFVWIRILRSVD